MSIRFLGHRTVIYPAPDLAAATAWWSEILGMAPYFNEPFYVAFNPGGYEQGLIPDGDVATGALAYWGVDDVARAVGSALVAGATEHSPVSEVGEGIITATVRTPQGSIVGFIFNPHFEMAPTEP